MSPAVRHGQAGVLALLPDVACPDAADGPPAPVEASLAPPAGHRIADEALLLARARVLQAARRIEPDLHAALAWYCEEPIAPLGRRTAESLVEAGEAERVLAFLARALRDLACVSR